MIRARRTSIRNAGRGGRSATASRTPAEPTPGGKVRRAGGEIRHSGGWPGRDPRSARQAGRSRPAGGRARRWPSHRPARLHRASGEPGGQPLQRSPAAKGITGNQHRRGQRWKFLARRRHDHDRSGHGRRQPHHALEHPLRTEGKPGLGLTHPSALSAAQNHRSHDQGRSSSPSVEKPISASLHRVSASSQSPRKAETAGRSQRSRVR